MSTEQRSTLLCDMAYRNFLAVVHYRREVRLRWAYVVEPAPLYTRQGWTAWLRDDPEFGSSYGPNPLAALTDLIEAEEDNAS